MSKFNCSCQDDVVFVLNYHSLGMNEHVEAVEKAQKSVRVANKACRNQLREIAQLLAYRHLHNEPVDRIACFHRDDGTVEFMNILANELTLQVLCWSW